MYMCWSLNKYNGGAVPWIKIYLWKKEQRIHGWALAFLSNYSNGKESLSVLMFSYPVSRYASIFAADPSYDERRAGSIIFTFPWFMKIEAWFKTHWNE